MNNIITILLKAIMITVSCWLVLFLSFSVINGTFKIDSWDSIQRGNLGGWMIFFYLFSLILSAIHEYNYKR